MLVRAIALSLAILVGIGTIVPLATEFVEAGAHHVKTKKKKRYWRGVKKYSKRWWQLYRAQERRKKRIAKRKRTMRLQNLRAVKQREAETVSTEVAQSQPKSPSTRKSETASAAVLPSGNPAPKGWKPAQTTPAELQFRVDNTAGTQVGSASISVVGPAMQENGNPRTTLGGVATTSLRREVIDRMIRENGWVVNDFKKEIAGEPVYVVVAQSQARNGTVQARMFYFTEVDGRIYSVATNSPVQEQERLAAESEKVVTALNNRRSRPKRAAVSAPTPAITRVSQVVHPESKSGDDEVLNSLFSFDKGPSANSPCSQ